MDPYGDSQPTQATQTVVDPRRLGQQSSGFSDEEISDIICLLVPYSNPARQEVRRIAAETSHHMVGREDMDGLKLDYTLEDESRNFAGVQPEAGQHHIALRFSSLVKDPSLGFTFGRSPAHCDICLLIDPHRRLSKIHFRIYLNEWGVLMLEDMSTNGTVVDEVLLKKREGHAGENKRTLSSGSKIKILMHEPGRDILFLVRIPVREGSCQEAYQRNLDAYLADQACLTVDANETIVPGPGGQVDIFRPAAPRHPAGAARNGANVVTARRAQVDDGRARQSNRPRADGLPRPWNGSDKYNRVCEIGRGAFATVHKVTSRLSGQPYAAKELDKRKFMKNGVLDQKVENEMRIMQAIKHPNIVEYIEHLDWDDRLLIIIMEFVGGGDLGRLIADNDKPLSESATKIMARQLLDALGYLHDMNITHRDVKPDNILVSSLDPFVVKLTDFGLSKMVDNEQTFLRTFCGTLLYCAPEVYSEYAEYDSHGRRHPRNRRLRPTTGQRYDHAVDIWSLGGVLFYALTKRPPFPARNGASHSELLHQIMTKPLDISPLVDADISEEGIDFLRCMLDRRPETRATVETLKNHIWISSSFSTVAHSFQEISEEELNVTASQLSLEDSAGKHEECRELRVPSDDEISDDEEVDLGLDENDFVAYESEKENYTFGPNNHPQQRLFGEVNISAVGSSGAIPASRLNLPVSAGASFGSTGTTEILGNDSEIRDSFESEASLTPRQKSQKSQPASGGLRGSAVLSVGQSRTVDELNNMTFDVASQSLGGAESILENLNMKSGAGSLLRSYTTGDLNTSKRKPSSDSSEEDELPVVQDRRGLKRLRSEGSAARLAIDRGIESGEYELLAQMPSILRAQSGRQIDNPVNKSTYWSAQDRKTWHLNYPEMTQLQLDAFKTAADARDEAFGPGKSPLWDLAMKYFPATSCEHRGTSTKSSSAANSDTEGNGPLPSTARPDASVPATPPDSERPKKPWYAKPTQTDPGRPVVAWLQSVPGSAVPDISVAVTESMVSWGRALDNTRSYAAKHEGKVPKYAFKILLWKPDYDPAKNFRPWNRAPAGAHEERAFQFYISTKATHGIHVNGVHLPSDDPKNPGGRSRYWMALHDGDCVSVWQNSDGSCTTQLLFRCTWGGSATPRSPSPSSSSPWLTPSQPHPPTHPSQQQHHRHHQRVKQEQPADNDNDNDVNNNKPPTLLPPATAQNLDEVCARAERKMRSLSEHDLKLEEANHDADERRLRGGVERERMRARAFEARRVEACRALGLLTGVGAGGRVVRGVSPAAAAAAVQAVAMSAATATGSDGGGEDDEVGRGGGGVGVGGGVITAQTTQTLPAQTTQQGQTQWSSARPGYGPPGGRTVPTFRHASPSTVEMLRAARRG